MASAEDRYHDAVEAEHEADAEARLHEGIEPTCEGCAHCDPAIAAAEDAAYDAMVRFDAWVEAQAAAGSCAIPHGTTWCHVHRVDLPNGNARLDHYLSVSPSHSAQGIATND